MSDIYVNKHSIQRLEERVGVKNKTQAHARKAFKLGCTINIELKGVVKKKYRGNIYVFKKNPNGYMLVTVLKDWTGMSNEKNKHVRTKKQNIRNLEDFEHMPIRKDRGWN